MHSNSRVKLSWMIKELQTCTRWQTCEVDRKNLLPIYGSIVSLFTNIHCCKHSIRICDVSLKLASKKIFLKGKIWIPSNNNKDPKANIPTLWGCIRILTHCNLYMYKRPPVKSRKVSHLFPHSLHSSPTVCLSVNIQPSVSFWTSVVEVACSIFKVSHNLI